MDNSSSGMDASAQISQSGSGKKKKGRKKWLIPAIIGGVVAAAAVFFLIFPNLWPFGDGGSSGKAYVVQVSTVSSSGYSGISSNRFSGVVEPQESKDINLDSGKTLGEIYVSVGDTVSAG
ncbi:MAG: hypothetical protein ACOX6J_05825, partial [Oscillospiraceae bacterium]